MNFLFKKRLIEQLKKQLQNDIALYENSLADLQDDISNETKSSAGDKFETSREMMEQERQKAELQLQRLRRTLQQIDELGSSKFEKIENGALVRCGKMHIFFFSGLNNTSLDGQKIYVSAITSPVGKALQGLGVGAERKINGNTFLVEELC